MYITPTSVPSEITTLTIQSNIFQAAEDQMERKVNLKMLLLLHQCVYVLIRFLVKQTKLFWFYKCTYISHDTDRAIRGLSETSKLNLNIVKISILSIKGWMRSHIPLIVN